MLLFAGYDMQIVTLSANPSIALLRVIESLVKMDPHFPKQETALNSSTIVKIQHLVKYELYILSVPVHSRLVKFHDLCETPQIWNEKRDIITLRKL